MGRYGNKTDDDSVSPKVKRRVLTKLSQLGVFGRIGIIVIFVKKVIGHSVVIAMIVLFLHYTSWDGEIFEGIKKVIKPKGKLYKPIYGCPVCMVPWYGSAIYWIFYGVGIPDYLLTIGVASGINVVLVVFLSIREACINYNKQEENEK